jgi:5-hydroxyisourate hydrolase
MTRVTTHVLDTSSGRPAEGVPVVLERAAGDRWEVVGEGTTDADGRVRELGPAVGAGRHRLRFDTAAYLGPRAFFPEVAVVFAIDGGEGARDHEHVPLLLSPYGYSTYRGS